MRQQQASRAARRRASIALKLSFFISFQQSVPLRVQRSPSMMMTLPLSSQEGNRMPMAERYEEPQCVPGQVAAHS